MIKVYTSSIIDAPADDQREQGGTPPCRSPKLAGAT
jgi:hypothetical protein